MANAFDDVTWSLEAVHDCEQRSLDAALARPSTLDLPLARFVELRCLGRPSIRESAQMPRVSSKTVEREWTTARLWLRREISGGAPI